ncbi:MAG TPA: SDR family NAD(P)-dependent oxidoreductase [Candidatus Acidoferrales bacterium]|nr:SDR family NAD(P)-dependent oxidoreductase [Candidatus Acidoferrales bacterium]
MPTETISRPTQQERALNMSGVLEDLCDKVAVVTGASSGIGRAIGLALAAEGAQVHLVARRLETLEEIAQLTHEQKNPARACRADLTRDEDIQSLAASLQRNGGRVDVLVHCAGEIHHAEHEQAPITDLDAQYRANVRGPYLLTQTLLPLLRAGAGQVVFVNSSSGLHAKARSGQFAATQHAMKAVADSFREEVNSDGIRVLCVFPGRTATPRTEKLFSEERKGYKPELLMQPEDVAYMVVHALKTPRTAEVTELHIRPLYKSY